MKFFKVYCYTGVEHSSSEDMTTLKYEGIDVIYVQGETKEEAADDFYDITGEWGCLGAYPCSEYIPISEEEYNDGEGLSEDLEDEIKKAKETGVIKPIDDIFPKESWVVKGYYE